MIHSNYRKQAIEKLAFFGPAPVTGAPIYRTPPLTVGQSLYSLPSMNLSPYHQREIHDKIVNSGLHVNKPAKSLLNAGIGALAGNFISTTLGMGPFMRGALTAIGANYGYNK